MAESVPHSLKDLDMESLLVLKAYIDARVEPWADRMREGDVTLREYVEGLLGEMRRAIIVADQEREKAARALHDEIARTITEGDRNLREHIESRVTQIQSALVAADELERSRLDVIMGRIESVRKELALTQDASNEAITKSENATDKRFESVNEFRANLADQSATFLPREVAEAQFAEVRRSISELAEKVGKVV